MSDGTDKEFQQTLHEEFLKALHEEKIKTQDERATYTTSKLAFVTGLFGLGSLRFSGVDFYWLLYLIPLVAIGYDLYIRAADASIKKMGAFLRSHPDAGTTSSEKAWESFSAEYRDRFAPFANLLFTVVVTIVAAIYIFIQEQLKSTLFGVVFLVWLAAGLLAAAWLWKSSRDYVNRLDVWEATIATEETTPQQNC